MRYVVPNYDVPPLPTVPDRLTTAEVEDILSANFTIVRKVEEVPTPVKNDYTAVTHHQFGMVNDGEPVSTDMIIPGVPNKRLVLVGVADQNAVLIYELFGLTGEVKVLVFSHKGGTGVWEATLNDSSVTTVEGLRNAVRNGQFELGI